jgi:type II secretory pathway component GspD/PulD (secretin)
MKQPRPNSANSPASLRIRSLLCAAILGSMPSATHAQTVVSTNAPASTNLDKTVTPDEIQVSFQGANIDMIVQWLSQTTGKSVLKHPRVQCQLTIVSSKKVTQRGRVCRDRIE